MSELDVEQAATHLPTFAGEVRDRGGITFTLDDLGRGASPLAPVEIAEQAYPDAERFDLTLSDPTSVT